MARISIVSRPVLILTALAGVFLSVNVAQAVRSASIANLTLAPLTYSHAEQVNTGTMVLTASDDGTAGWNVTILSSDFAYSGTSAGSAIPAANFSITTAQNPSLVSGQAIDSVGGPKVPPSGATGALNLAHKVLQANSGFGQGTYSQNLDVSLTVPAGSRAGTYTSTLTVTISAGP